MADNPSCFVIGPIGDRLADPGTAERQVYEDAIQVWEKVILPACEAAGLKPLRADHISRTGEIVDQVCRHLRDADVVIADLTGANPNVMYELGLRHTINRPTIQIGESARLPFDVSAIRTLRFKRSESGFIDARDQLGEAIRVGLAEGGDPVTATRTWNDLPHGTQSTSVPGIGDRDDEGEPGFLEKLVASDEGMRTMKSILESMATVMASIANLAETATEEVKRSDARGGGPRGRLIIAERLAPKLDAQGATLEAQAKEFEDCVNQIDPGIDYLLDRLEEDPSLGDQAAGFVEGLYKLAENAESNESMVVGFQGAMKESGEMSRSMRKATNRLVSAAGRQKRATQRFKKWRDRLQTFDKKG
ncbi:hypothetical protein ACFL6M_06695 [Candidatus Eisenbacteria bacterium]|uniref:DUF4071 domain-containing protein n=1 Tax=Eiseniibacteriota bacterium TaxID=2212470 RepID=A0ABV6YLR2_UNCEI